jgi:hypothetical protein
MSMRIAEVVVGGGRRANTEQPGLDHGGHQPGSLVDAPTVDVGDLQNWIADQMSSARGASR